MKKIIVRQNNIVLKIHISEDNTTIFDSYRIKSPKDMKDVIHKIITKAPDNAGILKRKKSGIIHEWRTHNLLYTLGIMTNRTKSVDLESTQPWYLKALYALISPFYFHFS